MKVLGEQLKKVQAQSGTQMDNSAVLHERRQTDVKQSETRLHFELNADRQSRKENEVKTGKIIDEKLYSLRLELAKEKKAREECNNRYDGTFGAQIDQISLAILEENKQREDSSQILVNVLSEEISKFHEQLD